MKILKRQQEFRICGKMDSLDNTMNTSIVNTSALQGGDFDMFLDCLDELCKNKTEDKRRKSRRQKRSKLTKPSPSKTSHKMHSNFNELFQNLSLNEQQQLDESMSVMDSTMNTSQWSPNQTTMTVNSEQLNNIFAYFDQNCTADALLLSDDSFEEHHNARPSEAPQLPKTDLPKKRESKARMEKVQNAKGQKNEIRSKSQSILNKIQMFNGVEPKTESVKRPLPSILPPKAKEGMQRYSSASTCKLSDSDNEFVFKKPFDVVDNGNVRRKVNYFTDPSSSSDRSSSASPSSQSLSDDEIGKFERTQSQRKFSQKRIFFENYFKGKSNDSKPLQSTSSDSESSSSLEKEPMHSMTFTDGMNTHNKNARKQIDVHATNIDPNEKLKAVQTYVQTKHLLERIQYLVSSISNLDEQRLCNMNLKLLKKFLTFIRDCSNRCTEVCNEISDNFLTDFEKNVMSAEDLLVSAMKMAHQVHTNG